MTERAGRLGTTPWQTVGPFFHYALPWPGGADLLGDDPMAGARPDLVPAEHFLLQSPPAPRRTDGEVIVIEGRILDGAGQPVPDALLEIWHADPEGRYDAPGFRGFGRAATNEDGAYAFRTLKPGRAPGPGDSLQASHIAVSVLARGLLKRLVTRIYFEGDDGLDADPVLQLVPPDRRPSLLARPAGAGRRRFDIVLQGAGETVFLEV